MRRLLSTLVLDAVVQARNHLYTIGLAMAVVWGLAARFALNADALLPWVPPLLLMHIGSTTYFFVAALVIFERDQDTLAAQSVTPLRFGEYLASKLVTLAVFGALETVVLLGLAGALADVQWMALFGAITVLGLFYGVLAFIQALPSRSITEFLIPNAMIMGVLLVLPILPYFGVGAGPLWFLFPTYGPFLLIVAATVGLSGVELAAAAAASGFWLALGIRQAIREYRKLWSSPGQPMDLAESAS